MRAIGLVLLLVTCSAPPDAPPVATVCAEDPELEEPTRIAVDRWTAATGDWVLYDCDHATAWVRFDPEVPSAADLYRGMMVRMQPSLDPALYETAIAHELGHLLEGSGRNEHAETGLMEPWGGDGRIDDASLAFVCAGAAPCSDPRPEE